MTTTAPSMKVLDDGIACDGPTNEFPSPRRPNNDNTRSEPSGRWTPEPQPATFDTMTEWGRKHLGEEWATEREAMVDDIYNSIVAQHPTMSTGYCKRQHALRAMEVQLQGDKVQLHGRELDELMSLARKRYGEGWYLNRRAARREKEMADPAEGEESYRSLRSRKRWWMARGIMRTRDEAMLSEGMSWDQILGSSQPPNATDDTETCTPAMSDVDSEWWEDDGAPLNQSEYAWGASNGPEIDTMQGAEWRAVAEGQNDEEYRKGRVRAVAGERSRAENEESLRRYHCEGPEAREKREEMMAHFLRVQHQAKKMLMEHDGLGQDPRYSEGFRHHHAEERLKELRGGDFTKLPDLELIAQSLGIRSSLPEHHDGLSSGSGPRPKQQQRKRPGSPQHNQRRQSRRLRQLPVEYEMPEDPNKIIRLANAGRRRRGP
ncbi:unnamed protein product [Clonostachys solani]|uniref:Uncharacterized protein n=1 Tax=Clonostachys solani TaxID=160281 RepID=A0A9P0ECG9_9HYPO|nr:unnamed protein product [Clonostachys solani]